MTQNAHSGSDELAEFIIALYQDLGDRSAFDKRLHDDVTVWESVDPRLLTGIAELNELRGPDKGTAAAGAQTPSVVPVQIVTSNWGDTGLIRYVLEVREHASAPVTVLVRVTDVVRRSNEGWRIVHHHAQDLTPETN